MFRNNLFSSARGMLNNSLPFSVPNLTNSSLLSNASKAITGTSKLSFTSILENASKTVNTINQIVPLYNQVKPMISNAKTAFNIFKNVKNIDSNKNTININEAKKEETNNEVKIDNTLNSKDEKEPNIIINKINPNKPFFV